MVTVDEVKGALDQHCRVTITSEERQPHSVLLRTKEGPVLNVFDTGRVVVQGKRRELVAGAISALEQNGGQSHAEIASRTVFVVYGHDEAARNELEAMLRRWKLEPLVLDNLTSEGDTLIEKLERYGKNIAFAVVLATPDDEGHPAGKETDKKFRSRQNVVLELGMMLSKLGRKKVAILLKKLDDGVMEPPSDIAGLIYIPFSDSVTDARVQLAKELNKQGLKIDLDQL